MSDGILSPITHAEIRAKALELEWDDVGITKAQIPEEDILAYRQWISEGFHADLEYMANPVRCSPQDILPGAKTAILFVTNYKQEKLTPKENAGIIASYARNRDYHHLHRKRLKKFILWLEERSGQKNIAKGFSDSTPVMEKALAVQAGLGWFGKNTLLIHRKFGTFTLLSGLFTTLTIENPTLALRLPRCGSCTRCLDACPTQALVSPYNLDAAKCLSYHLIESKKPIPEEIQRKNPGYVFGCDICQDACPHNVRNPLSENPYFHAETDGYLTEEKLAKWEEAPETLFGTPLQRRGVAGLKYSLETLSPKVPEIPSEDID